MKKTTQASQLYAANVQVKLQTSNKEQLASGTPKFSLGKREVNQSSSAIFTTAEFPSSNQNKGDIS